MSTRRTRSHRRRRDAEKQSLLGRIFYPRAPKRTPSAAELKAQAEYRHTGKHFWYGVTEETDFPVGRYADCTEARAAARRYAERRSLGTVLRIYHLDISIRRSRPSFKCSPPFCLRTP